MRRVTYDAGSVTLEQVREYVWEIPAAGGMRVPAHVLASEKLLDQIADDKTLEQLTNSAHLPGVQKHTLCMPDGHQGYGVEADLEHCEDEGYRPDADPDAVPQKAKERGKSQVGSLGAGNHFLERQRVTDIYRDDVAESFGLEADAIVVLIHCGSRGLGHQLCTEYLRKIEKEHGDLLAELPDKELAAAPPARSWPTPTTARCVAR